MLAAATGRDVRLRASDAFVVKTFDIATSFEAKLESLSYRAPALVAATLADAGLAADRQSGLNPDHPAIRASHQRNLIGSVVVPDARASTCDYVERRLSESSVRSIYLFDGRGTSHQQR